MEEENQRISKYSSGINIILRLDNLWKDTHTHSRQGSYYLWNLDLDRIWLELARDINEKKYEEYEKKFNNFENNLSKIGGIKDNMIQGFKKVSDEEKINRGKQYKILMNKQLFLARLENELGKGTTLDDDDEDDFD